MNNENSCTIKSAKIKFLEILQNWRLFGATFFHANVNNTILSVLTIYLIIILILTIYVKNVLNAKIHNDCLVAINKHGIYLLAKQTLITLFFFKFSEIISTRRYMNEQNYAFIDIKTGDLIQQQIIKIQTNYVN